MKYFKSIDGVTINEDWMWANYRKYNILYFNSELPLRSIKMTVVCKKFNWYGEASREGISLNLRYEQLELEWINILLHEMIHIWQLVKFNKGGHGYTFQTKAKEINKFGWGITTYRTVGIK